MVSGVGGHSVGFLFQIVRANARRAGIFNRLEHRVYSMRNHFVEAVVLAKKSKEMTGPKHASQRTVAGHHGCNQRASWPPSQSMVIRHHSDALVKLTLSLFTVILLLTACRQHKESADDKMQKALAGTWIFEGKYASGDNHEQRISVAPDGNYILTIIRPGRTNGPRPISVEGTFRVEGGFLVDTLTKVDQTNAPVLTPTRIRIIRIDGREFVLDNESLPSWTVNPTNQIIYLKQTK
jgi:hypothetical protein